VHLIEYLKELKRPDRASTPPVDWPTWEPYIAFEVEYRLACSGVLYNRRVITADWRKSDASRILLREPVELFVTI
jgi:hypothetical protein